MKTAMIVLWSVVGVVVIIVAAQHFVHENVIGQFTVNYPDGLLAHQSSAPAQVTLFRELRLCPDCVGIYEAQCTNKPTGDIYSVAYWEQSRIRDFNIHCSNNKSEYEYEVSYGHGKLAGRVTVTSDKGTRSQARVEFTKMANQAL